MVVASDALKDSKVTEAVVGSVINEPRTIPDRRPSGCAGRQRVRFRGISGGRLVLTEWGVVSRRKARGWPHRNLATLDGQAPKEPMRTSGGRAVESLLHESIGKQQSDVPLAVLGRGIR